MNVIYLYDSLSIWIIRERLFQRDNLRHGKPFWTALTGENFLNLRSSIFSRPMYFLDVHDGAHDAGKCFLANALHCQGCSKAACTRPPLSVAFKIRRWATASSQHVDAPATFFSFFYAIRRKIQWHRFIFFA